MLAISLFSSSIAVNAASGSMAGSSASVVEENSSRSYSVPITFYNGDKITVNPDENSSDKDWAIQKGVWTSKNSSGATVNIVRPQFNERALVTAKEDGTYEVKLQFHAYSKFSYLQVLDPQQLSAVKDYAQENSLTFTGIPVSAANCSEGTINWLNSSFSEYISDSDEIKGFYLPAEQVTLAQPQDYENMDMGTVTFTVNNLSGPLVLQCGQQEYNTRFSMVGYLDQGQAGQIPDELFDGGNASYNFDYAWTNGFALVATSPAYSSNALRGNAVALSTLKNMVSSEVPVTSASGETVNAAFQLNPAPVIPSSGVPLTIEEIKQASQKVDTSGINYLLDQNGTEYESLTADGSLEISFSSKEDLVFGRWLQILAINTKAKGKTYYNGCLHAVPYAPKDVEVLENLPDTQFEVTRAETYEDLKRVDQEVFESYSAIARDDRYRFYKLSLKNTEGTEVSSTLSETVTLRFSVPEGWDMDRLFLFQWSSKTNNILTNYTTDTVSRTISIKTSDSSYLNSEYLFAERADAMDLTTVLQEDGLYQVQVSVMNAYQNKPSMAIAAFAGNQAYLDVKDGEGRLYVEFQGIHIAGLLGYLANFFYLDGGATGEQSQSDHLQYHWNTDDGGMAAEYGLTYLQRASIPLTTPDTDGAYWVRFSVPIMDGLTNGGVPGDGSGAQPARLLIVDAEKIDESNPWAGYDKSILKAKISDAEKQLQNLDNSEKAALQAAIDEAQRTYDSSPDSDEVLSTVQALASAMGGTEDPGGEEPDPDTADLEQAIADAEEYEADEYEDTSFEALAAMIDAAKAAQDRDDLTEEQAQAQVDALEASVDALVSLDELEKMKKRLPPR